MRIASTRSSTSSASAADRSAICCMRSHRSSCTAPTISVTAPISPFAHSQPLRHRTEPSGAVAVPTNRGRARHHQLHRIGSHRDTSYPRPGDQDRGAHVVDGSHRDGMHGDRRPLPPPPPSRTTGLVDGHPHHRVHERDGVGARGWAATRRPIGVRAPASPRWSVADRARARLSPRASAQRDAHRRRFQAAQVHLDRDDTFQR
jgi:hypothetical protein